MNNFDLIERNETNLNSKGGTELLQKRLYNGLVSRELLTQFQIISSRVRNLDSNKFRIYWAHDLAGDPEADNALADGGWKRFHMLVFVSNWQMQSYIQRYNLPWSHCLVIPNSIEPIDCSLVKQVPEKLKLIYTSTPHRGLNILYSVFNELCKKHDNIELDVYSSFKLYGWGERDAQYEDLFSKLKEHDRINYHGTASNDEVRLALTKANIFAYPSIWPETSCLCLIEAMSAGLMCVHSNYGALYETAAGWTYMYQYDEDINRHASVFYSVLDQAINNYGTDNNLARMHDQGLYADSYHDWNRRSLDWTGLLKMIIARNPNKELPKPSFTYST